MLTLAFVCKNLQIAGLPKLLKAIFYHLVFDLALLTKRKVRSDDKENETIDSIFRSRSAQVSKLINNNGA